MEMELDLEQMFERKNMEILSHRLGSVKGYANGGWMLDGWFL